MVALLFSPWASLWAWAKLPLLILVLWEARCMAQRRRAYRGELRIEQPARWHWHGQSWQLKPPLRWLPFGVLVLLRNAEGQRLRFWLMRDAMPPAAWRALRAFWLNH